MSERFTYLDYVYQLSSRVPKLKIKYSNKIDIYCSQLFIPIDFFKNNFNNCQDSLKISN